MPDLLAHYDVAEAARARLAPGRLARLLAEAPDAYAVGAQGPDFLFYSHLWPDGHGRSDLAFLAHQRRMSETFATMLGLAGEAPAPDRSALYAFVCGYAAHLCLDAGAHPWILYWTGDVSRGIGSATEARAMRRHGILEASIDVMLAARHRPPCFRWPRSRRLLSLEPSSRRSVAAMWSRVMLDVHGVSFTPREASAALRDMAWVYGSMTDRRSPLSLLLRAGGGRLDPRGLVRTQIYPDAPHPAAVTLVAEGGEWRAPSRPDEPRTETFAEICDQAVDETATCLRAIEGAAFGGDDLEAAIAVIGDRNMITGVACGDPRPLVAFAPDREGLWGEA
jgi:hypothetical protein